MQGSILQRTSTASLVDNLNQPVRQYYYLQTTQFKDQQPTGQ